MRKTLLLPLAVLVVAGLVAPPASAFTFEVGTNYGEMVDWGSFYTPNPLGGDRVPQPLGKFAQGDWDQTVFQIQTLYEPPVPGPATAYYSWLSGGNELCGLVYDLEVVGITVVDDRNTPLDPTDDLVDIDLGSAGRFDTDTGGGASAYTLGRVDIWEGVALNANPALGPQSWGYGAAGVAGWDAYPFDPGEYDTYPTFTDDATPILSATYLSRVGKPGVAITLNLDFRDGTGDATQAHILLTYNGTPSVFETLTRSDGALYNISLTNRFDFWPSSAPGITFEPILDNPTTDPVYWATQSNDPLTFTILPEPASLSLLGLALAGIGVARRRRKRS